MKHFITAITILSICGCHTTKHVCPTDPQTQKITVSAIPSDKTGKKLDKLDADSFLNVEFNVIKMDGTIISRRMRIKQNKWATSSLAITIIGLKQTAELQIDDEIIEVDCSPGFLIKVKAIFLGENKVQLKGAYVYSDYMETNLTKPKEIMPFSVIVETGKTISLYELKTEFEPTAFPSIAVE